MRFQVDVCGTTLLFTEKQLAALVRAIDNVERIEDKYIGNGQGTNGSNYIKLLRPVTPSATLRVNVMSGDEYEAMKLVTKIQDEKQ